MGGACSSHGRDEKCTESFCLKPAGKRLSNFFSGVVPLWRFVYF